MKKGFLEMECISLKEVWEFEKEQHKADCKFVTSKSMMDDTIVEVYSVYGEIADPDLCDYVEEDSTHGNGSLKELYEKLFM